MATAPKPPDPTREQAQRVAAWQRAWRFYNGTPPKPLIVRAGEPDDNVILSFGRLIVDKGSSFLFGQDVTSEAPGGGAAQAWLDECWRRNKRGLALQKLSVNGGVTGQAFAKLVPAPRPGDYPRVVVLDTQTVDVVWADDDYEDVLEYQITSPRTETEQRRQLIQRLDSGTWQIVDQVQDLPAQDGIWHTVRTSPWPYTFAPIVACQNLPAPNDFWGIGDLTDDVIHILLVLNRVASHYAKIIRVHAYPKTWSRGLGSRTIRAGIDDVINLPSETAELHNLEMQSDLSSTAALLDRLLDYLSFISRTPKVALGAPDQEGALSGVAMQLRYAPLVEKTETKRRTYGDLLVELDRGLLALGGWGEQIVTQLHWPELLPSDPLQERQALVIDDSLGVSTETILTKLGYDPAIEATRKAEEAAKAAALQQAIAPVPPPTGMPAPVPDAAKPNKLQPPPGAQP